MKFKTTTIGEIAEVQTGPFGSQLHSEDYVSQGIPIVTVEHLGRRKFSTQNLPQVSEEDKQRLSKYILKTGDLVFSRVGSVDRISYVSREEDGWLFSGRCLRLRTKVEVDSEWLYYFFCREDTKEYIRSIAVGATMPSINTKLLSEIVVTYPEKIENQKKIASILSKIDDKIELNNEINNNLLEQVMAIYRNRFVDTTNDMRKNCRADEYFSISIGKTPPRKEPQWFTEEHGNVTWVSISDMGDCGTFISDSSEYLTAEAVQKFNVQIVPDHTVLLSFKLTVGRVAITVGKMTTNEAIAHFKTPHKDITEYLYCYLKAFNYQSLGSTSSIATAVNSKIIKAMPFIVPTEDEIAEFHAVAAPIFEKIKANQVENIALVSLRESLLPRLMSGELDVSAVEF